MLVKVTMKQSAIAEFEIDEETTDLFIEALDSAIENPNDDIDYPNEKRRLLYALVDIKMMFESIKIDFGE